MRLSRKIQQNALAVLLVGSIVPSAFGATDIHMGTTRDSTTDSTTAAIKHCQALKDRIEHYSDLRRKGGKAARMDKWKKERGKSEAKFREKKCRRYRSKLR